MMVELVSAGLASVTTGRVVARSRKIEVVTLRITEGGAAHIGGMRPR
jgi:hypothetical protein